MMSPYELSMKKVARIAHNHRPSAATKASILLYFLSGAGGMQTKAWTPAKAVVSSSRLRTRNIAVMSTLRPNISAISTSFFAVSPEVKVRTAQPRCGSAAMSSSPHSLSFARRQPLSSSDLPLHQGSHLHETIILDGGESS